MSQEDEFYEDLDKRAVRRSCCTCQTMMIFFGALVIIIAGLIIYGFYLLRQINISPKDISFSVTSQQSFKDKLLPDSKEPQVTLSFTSEELTSVASQGLETSSFQIKEIQIIVEKDNVKIFGKLVRPIKSDIEITTIPKVENGKIFFQIQQVKTGKLSLPGFLNTQIQTSLNSMMDSNFSPLYENYQIENVILESNKMAIIGQLK